MAAGTRRHRITFQARGAGRDALNQPLPDDWADVKTVWANIEPLNGRELMLAQANRSETTHSVSILYQALFADAREVTAMRIVFGTRIFNIHSSIDPGERRRDLILSCSEGLNDG